MQWLRRWAAGVAVPVAGLLLIVAVVSWLRQTAPEASVDTSVRHLLGEDDVELTCEVLEGTDREAAESFGRAIATEVLTCPVSFDGRGVRYVGEVVGEVLERDGGAWALVNDDAYALDDGPLEPGGAPTGLNSGLTVWFPGDTADVITTPGRHDVRGDVVEVFGVIEKADPEDGGGLTLRAATVRLLSPAIEHPAPVHTRQVAVAVVVAVLVLGALVADRWPGRGDRQVARDEP